MPTAAGLVLAMAAAIMLAGGLSAGPAWCQNTTKPSRPDWMASLYPGQWIQLDGQVRENAVTLCTEVRQLSGDFLDDDWSIKGTIQTLDIVRQEFTVGGCRIQVTGSTTYDDPHGKIKGIGELRIGMLTDVEGTFLRNKSLVAAEVDDESQEMVHKPALKSLIEIVGRIEKIDTRTRVITVMGVDFQITEKTKVRSAVQ